jgi:hypothetical protein
MEKMQNYIIELELQSGGIEKTTTKLVTAANKEDAEREALLSELHNFLGDGAEWDDDDENSGRIWDFYQEWVYTVDKVTLIESEEDYTVLKKYL